VLSPFSIVQGVSIRRVSSGIPHDSALAAVAQIINLLGCGTVRGYGTSWLWKEAAN
jgi:hypothetical protein